MKRANFKTLLAGVALAAALGMGAAGEAAAAVVTFDSHTPPPGADYTTEPNAFDDGGLHFEGGQFYFIPPALVSLPTPQASIFMETALEPVVISRAGGGVFDLLSIMLGLGEYNSAAALDRVTVTGTRTGACGGACTVSADLQVGYGFTTFDLTGFTGLSSVSFGVQQTPGQGGQYADDTGYLAFDNVRYAVAGAAVPEPAGWSMLILGFAGLGALLRRRRATFGAA